MPEKKGSGKAQRCLEDALSGIVALWDRIVTARAETLAIEAEAEGSILRELLAEPDMRRLVASVLAVVEREVGNKAARKRNFL